MADGEQRTVFPMIPARIWWQLRARARQAKPSDITIGYIATACGISEKAAGNILPNLRRLGLVEKDGTAPTDRLFQWRDDESYSKVCQDMLNDTYPAELREAVPGSAPDRTQAERWFMSRTRAGEGTAKQMAAFYALLAKGDPSDAEQANGDVPKSKSNGRARAPTPKAAAKLAGAAQATEPPPQERAEVKHPKPVSPSMHIDIQVHISPQASPEQIDAIFASMGRHLYHNVA